MTKKTMLTTVDNPFSPFDEFGAWYTYDVSSGYHTSSFLARILVDSDQLSEPDQDRAMELAIDEIIKENVNGVFKKITKEVDD
jgi:hypothetical protein